MPMETAKLPEPPKEEVSSSSDIPITANPTSLCATPSSTEPAIPIPTSPVAASPQKLEEEAEAKSATQLDLTNVRDPGLTVDSPPRDAHLATDQTVDTAKDKPMEPDATPAKLSTTQEPDPSPMLVEPNTLPDSKSEVPTVADAPVPTLAIEQPPNEPAENIVPPSPERPALDEIPKFADTMHERLRIVVMTRLAHDTQSREEIIAPILTTNLSIARHEYRKGTTADVLMQEILSGDKAKTRLESLEACKPSLVQQFETRQTMLMEKVERLRNEYIDLHEKWLVHCATLDEQAKPSETEAVQPSGRTTRRTANLTDTVRSDLEMEQIIASLGNDDATDPNHLSQRNLAVIPDMISVTRGQVDYAFDDTNHLVTDPHEYYAPRTGIDDWTEEEKTILCDKFAAHPKQFGIIADYLPNKTQAQCVSYYYLHKKKFINFRKVVAQRGPGKRKRRSDKRKGNALLTDIQRHDEELEGDSMSPAPTSAPTTTSSGRPRRRAAAQQPAEPVASRRPQPRRSNAHQLEATPASTPTPEPESRVRRRRSNQVVAPPTPVEEPEEDPATDPEQRPAKKPKRGRKVVKSAAIIPDDIIMDDTASEPPSTRPQSATPFQLPTLSEEQQLVMINLIKDYMNPQMAANSKPPTPVIGYPGTGIMIPNPPTVGATRYADIPISRSPAGRPSEPMYPGAGIMSPIMGHTSMDPASQPNAHFSANGEHMNAGSSRISFHANPWVPSNFSAGSSRGSTPQPIAPQPMVSSNPYGSGMPVLHTGRHLDSTFPSHPSSYGPPIPGGIPMGMPMPMGPSPLGLPSYPPTQLSMTSAGPPTSLERAESRLYRASGTFVPMSMASPIPLDSGPGSRGRNPYPVVPTSFSSSYNLPR
ncbi:DNA-binding protein snt1 [Pleurotus ostreatus]|nr:DNA-binding protein snt1 [Pleurotus ostreatus]